MTSGRRQTTNKHIITSRDKIQEGNTMNSMKNNRLGSKLEWRWHLSQVLENEKKSEEVDSRQRRKQVQKI